MKKVSREEEREMPLTLDHWQERLERHFTSLSAMREQSGFPIFALEHPLSPSEVDAMSALLRENISVNHHLGPHLLCWVVYATEIGYGYAGDEYWQSFEEATPGWLFEHRNALRTRFRKFQQSYGGVRPSGAWALQFPIIAWPITHAILPKYLQLQFAYAIYQLRFRLARLSGLDSLSAGQLLASYSYDTSTRFQKFLQQEELTGRILLGLLGIAPESGPAPIYEPTLTRIVDDLDKVQATRSRLRETRTVVDRFKGLGRPGVGYSRSDTGVRDKATDSFPHPDISPRIFLRHKGGGNWSLVIDMPSFAPVASLQPDIASYLRRTRCRIAGAPDVKPAGWVLSHRRVSIIKSWPGPDTPLIQFVSEHPLVDRIVKSDCLLSTGMFWLFRIGSDGIAREIIGRVVRPGYNYIVLSSNSVPHGNPMVSATSLECTGVNAYRLSMPAEVSAEDAKWLRELGIQVARTVRVWPAGLPCRGWDGEGQSEWLTTDEPCFGIVHDHPVAQYIVSLDGSAEAVFPARGIGEPTFIRLQSLPAGKHKLTITAKRHDSIAEIAQQSSPEGVAQLLVREPEPWIPGVPSHTGLVVSIDPHDANLDEFWENKVAVSVAGPESHSVNCSVSLERSDGEEIFEGSIPGTFPLPLSPSFWQKKFEALVRKEEATSWRYPEASVGRLHIHGGELGEYVTAFHRDVAPVRWVTKHTSAGLTIKLIDDTGLPDDPLCKSFSMTRPIAPISNDVSELTQGLASAPPGALFVARHREHQDAIVVSHGLAGQGLEGLGVRPDFSKITDNEVPVTQAVRALELWLVARLAGPLAEIRRSQVTRELSSIIFGKLCGQNWAQSERMFEKASKPDAAADTLHHRIGGMSGFGGVLKRDYAKFLDDSKSSSAWYFDLAKRYRVSKNAKMCQFAIRLSFLPQTLSSVYGSDLEDLVKSVSSEQQLIRGARFGALLCARHVPNEYAQFVRRQRWQ